MGFFKCRLKSRLMQLCRSVSVSVHGSAASLLSGGSSLYGNAEERQAHEIRRLKRELQDARDQVLSLSSQLSTNVSTSPSKYLRLSSDEL